MVHTLAITLLRHGLTEENRQKRFIGWTDSPLSAEGEKQLLHYTYPTPDYIISSDLKRCKETYQCIYSSDQSIPIHYSSNWRETSFGEWERKTHEELKENFDYEQWLQNWEISSIPGGESFSVFSSRVMEGWHEARDLLLSGSINHVAIITHGGPIRKIVTEFAPMNQEFWKWQVDHGTGFLLETTPEKLRRNERCISLLEVPFKGSGNGLRN
jgi:alpha-ribazole phosphatase